MIAATARLCRLLAMVPWLLNRQGVALTEAAEHFGITEEQLVQDLELLFVCGMPGHMPDDLIEAEWDSGRVYLDNAEAISRPLRLAPDEAITLIAGLRMLAELPVTDSPADRAAVESALVKLSAAAQDAVGLASRLQVDLSAGAQQDTLRIAREALAGARRLRMRYIAATRDEVTERDVDPMRVANLGGRWYLEAWCHRAEDVRLFRVDRIAGLELLDLPGVPPEQARRRDVEEELFRPAPDDLLVTLEVEPRGRWVAEYYPVESVEELSRGRLRVALKVADPRWLPGLIMRLGGAGRIVSPPELVADVLAAIRSALEGYPSRPARRSPEPAHGG